MILLTLSIWTLEIWVFVKKIVGKKFLLSTYERKINKASNLKVLNLSQVKAPGKQWP